MKNMEPRTIDSVAVKSNYVEEKRLFPIVKWAGGKDQELKYIIPKLPANFTNYFEPFVGGGAVYTALQADNYFINDKSEELIALYRSISNDNRDVFFAMIAEIIHNWEVLEMVVERNQDFFLGCYKSFADDSLNADKLKINLYGFIVQNAGQFNGMFSTNFNFDLENFLGELLKNLVRKLKRMKVLQAEKGALDDENILINIETSLKSAFYMHFRYIYNHRIKYEVNDAFQSAIFLFIRNYAYSGMFRYNSRGEFNVPYGGIGYNRKNFQKKIDYLKSEELNSFLDKTVIENLDFEEFLLKHNPKENDFVFLDPPYDSEFSTYSQNTFDRTDQERLAHYLIRECKGKWMMIIKQTDYIFSLYVNKPGINIEIFDKTYLVSFMNRNQKRTKHLLIRNY